MCIIRKKYLPTQPFDDCQDALLSETIHGIDGDAAWFTGEFIL